jgi:hypothetical protein
MMPPYSIIWNGGTLDWRPVRHTHLTLTGKTSLCGLKVTGYYESHVDLSESAPVCKRCAGSVNKSKGKTLAKEKARR